MSIVRDNLMNREGYAPYCGEDHCFNRAPFNGRQFQCRCGWQSSFEPEFIAAYKAKWATPAPPVISESLQKVLAIAEAGFALAQYASYAEIVGALSMNRQQVREGCDAIFRLNGALDSDLDAAEAPMFSDNGLWENAIERFRSLTPSPEPISEGVKFPLPAWKEQAAFEEWANDSRYEMSQHPLHYLFVDKQTNAARQGWKAALDYIRKLSEGSNND